MSTGKNIDKITITPNLDSSKNTVVEIHGKEEVSGSKYTTAFFFPNSERIKERIFDIICGEECILPLTLKHKTINQELYLWANSKKTGGMGLIYKNTKETFKKEKESKIRLMLKKEQKTKLFNKKIPPYPKFTYAF